MVSQKGQDRLYQLAAWAATGRIRGLAQLQELRARLRTERRVVLEAMRQAQKRLQREYLDKYKPVPREEARAYLRLARRLWEIETAMVHLWPEKEEEQNG